MRNNINIENYIGCKIKSFIVIGVENINGRNMVLLQCQDCENLKRVRKTRFLDNEFSDCSCKSKPLDIGIERNGFIVIDYTERYNRFAYVIACTDCGNKYIVQKSQLENNKNMPKCPCKGRTKKYRTEHKCDSLIGQVLEERHFLIVDKVRLPTGEIGVKLECTECGNTYEVDYRLLIANRYGFCSCDDRYMRNKTEGAIKKYNGLLNKQIGELFIKKLCKDKYYYYICDCNCGNKDVKIDAARLFNGLCYACPECHLSFGETAIKNFLDEHNILYKTQVHFDDLIGEKSGRFYRFDFGVYSKTFDNLICLIEFDGPQHDSIDFYMLKDNLTKEEAEKKLEDCQIRDKLKTDFCIKNNIPLLRIKYKRSKKYINDILLNFLM